MKYAELQNKDIKELTEMAKEARIKLGRFKFDLANKTLKDFSQIGKVRKEIAQIFTAITAKSRETIDNSNAK